MTRNRDDEASPLRGRPGLPQHAPPPWVPEGILENLQGSPRILDFDHFFWEPRDAFRDPVALLKTGEPQSAGEPLALRFRIGQSLAPPRNQGSEVLHHF